MDIHDITQAASGRKKIDWVRSYMPILSELEGEFAKDRPFEELRVSISIHLEAKTANLALLLKAGGAQVSVTGCNPLSTQDDVAAALAAEDIEVNARHGVGAEEYEKHLHAALSQKPHLIIDDGGDFVKLLHEPGCELGSELIGGCEETTTGVMRLHARQREGALRFPMVSVNDADCKHLFDNRYGTGQSVWDGIMRTTNLIVAGKIVVVAGYGWCGRGIALRAKGLGAQVVVTEIDPVKAIEAIMDGFDVMPMDGAAAVGDLFITATGCRDVITGRHFERMKDGAVLCNAGHFDVEVNGVELAALATEVSERKPNITGYTMEDGRVLNLLAQGRLVNLASGDGHPAEIMDMSFGIQALCLRYLAEQGRSLSPEVYPVPREIDGRVALLKLSSMGVGVDELTPEQETYLMGVGE